MVLKFAVTCSGAAALDIWPLSLALGCGDWEWPGLTASSESQNHLVFSDF